MELFSILLLAFGSSIVVGYLGVAFEYGAKKLRDNCVEDD